LLNIKNKEGNIEIIINIIKEGIIKMKRRVKRDNKIKNLAIIISN